MNELFKFSLLCLDALIKSGVSICSNLYTEIQILEKTYNYVKRSENKFYEYGKLLKFTIEKYEDEIIPFCKCVSFDIKNKEWMKKMNEFIKKNLPHIKFTFSGWEGNFMCYKGEIISFDRFISRCLPLILVREFKKERIANFKKSVFVNKHIHHIILSYVE